MMKRDTRPLANLHTVFLGFLNIFMFGSANENIDCRCKTIEFFRYRNVIAVFLIQVCCMQNLSVGKLTILSIPTRYCKEENWT